MSDHLFDLPFVQKAKTSSRTSKFGFGLWDLESGRSSRVSGTFGSGFGFGFEEGGRGRGRYRRDEENDTLLESGPADDVVAWASRRGCFGHSVASYARVNPTFRTYIPSHTLSNGGGVLFANSMTLDREFLSQYIHDVKAKKYDTLFVNEMISDVDYFAWYLDLDAKGHRPLTSEEKHRIVVCAQQVGKRFYTHQKGGTLDRGVPESAFRMVLLSREPTEEPYVDKETGKRGTYTDPDTGVTRHTYWKGGLHLVAPNINVTHEQAMVMCNAARVAAERELWFRGEERCIAENPWSDVFDLQVYRNGLRMPFSHKSVECPTCKPERTLVEEAHTKSRQVYTDVLEKERERGLDVEDAIQTAKNAEQDALRELMHSIRCEAGTGGSKYGLGAKIGSTSGSKRRGAGNRACSHPFCNRGKVPDNRPYTVQMAVSGNGSIDIAETARYQNSIERTVRNCTVRRVGLDHPSPMGWTRFDGCPPVEQHDFESVMGYVRNVRQSGKVPGASKRRKLPSYAERDGLGFSANQRTEKHGGKNTSRIAVEYSDEIRRDVIRGLFARYGGSDNRFRTCVPTRVYYRIEETARALTRPPSTRLRLFVNVKGEGSARCLNRKGGDHKSCAVYFIITPFTMVQRCPNSRKSLDRRHNGPCSSWGGGPPLRLTERESDILFGDILTTLKPRTKRGNTGTPGDADTTMVARNDLSAMLICEDESKGKDDGTLRRLSPSRTSGVSRQGHMLHSKEQDVSKGLFGVVTQTLNPLGIDQHVRGLDAAAAKGQSKDASRRCPDPESLMVFERSTSATGNERYTIRSTSSTGFGAASQVQNADSRQPPRIGSGMRPAPQDDEQSRGSRVSVPTLRGDGPTALRFSKTRKRHSKAREGNSSLKRQRG